MSKVPKAYGEFVDRFPEMAKAWDNIRAEEEQGPLDEKTRRLIKYGIAVGSQQTGPSHSAIRKAIKSGASVEELEQIVALSAATIGLPAAVAAWCRIKDTIEK